MNYYQGIKGLYFGKLLRTLVEVGDLKKKKVLDFGCGTKELQALVGWYNYVGYDIDPTLTDISSEQLGSLEYDAMVSNEVFYEISEEEIRRILESLKPKELVVGISRQSWLNKIGAMLLHPSALDKTKTSPKRELEILKEYYTIEKQKSVWGLADVYLMKRI